MGTELVKASEQGANVGIVRVKKSGSGNKDGVRNDVKDTAKLGVCLFSLRLAGNAAEDFGMTKTPLVEGLGGAFAMLAGKKGGFVNQGGKAAVLDALVRVADGVYKGGKGTLVGEKKTDSGFKVTEKA